MHIHQCHSSSDYTPGASGRQSWNSSPPCDTRILERNRFPVWDSYAYWPVCPLSQSLSTGLAEDETMELMTATDARRAV